MLSGGGGVMERDPTVPITRGEVVKALAADHVFPHVLEDKNTSGLLETSIAGRAYFPRISERITSDS